MEHNNKTKSPKFYFLAFQIITAVLSCIMGSVLIIITMRYLNDVTIVKTFGLLLYIYVFQLIVQFFKNAVLYSKLNHESNVSVTFSTVKKFLAINFITFSLIGITSLGFILLGLFFSNIKYISMFLLIIFVSIEYFFYNICIFKICNSKFNRYNLTYIKENFIKNFALIIFYVLVVFMSFISFKFVFNLNEVCFVLITLLDIILLEVTRIYLNKFLN